MTAREKPEPISTEELRGALLSLAGSDRSLSDTARYPIDTLDRPDLVRLLVRMCNRYTDNRPAAVAARRLRARLSPGD